MNDRVLDATKAILVTIGVTTLCGSLVIAAFSFGGWLGLGIVGGLFLIILGLLFDALR